MKKGKEALIIIIFALLHASTSYTCRKIGIGDDLLLTLLTMFMTFIICLRHKVSTKFMVISLIVVNLAGLLLGLGIAKLFLVMSLPTQVSHPLATLMCTTFIGWIMDMTARRYSRNSDDASYDVYENHLGWYVAAFVTAIILRVIFIAFFSVQYDPKTLIIGITIDYIFSCIAILVITIMLMKRMNIANYRYETLHKQVETEKHEGYMNQLIIKCGHQIIPVNMDQVAYFFSENKMNHVVLDKGTTYTIESTISDLELKLDPNSFFRVSRGCIIAKKSIASITSIESGRLAIETTPKNDNVITVSRARVDDFMSWIK